MKKTKMYFENEDSEVCYPLGYYIENAKEEGLDESIDEETGKPYGWSNYWNEEECMEWDEVEETYFQSVAVS